jgi:hypothetical protein
VNKLQTIEAEIQTLPREDQEELQDWLASMLEDDMELNPDFVAVIERGKAEIRAGGGRVVRHAD